VHLISLPVTAAWFLLAVGLVALLPAGRALRRRARARAPWVVLAALLVVVLGADGVNAYFSYLPRLGDVAGVPTWPTVPEQVLAGAPVGPQPRGAVVQWHLDDGVAHAGRQDVWTYLPPQWFTSPGRRFPVVYLLHGSPGVPQDWLRAGGAVEAGLAAARAGHPALVVLPRVGRGWLDDSECVDGAQEKAQTYLVHDVVTQVDARLRTVPARGARTIAGMSAGGYCALNVGLRHRDVFGTVLDLSGLTRPTHVGGARALYGAAGQRHRDTPQEYVDSLPAAPATTVWLDVGRGDEEVRPVVTSIAPRLRARGLHVELHLRPGGHTFHVWRPALAQALPWAAARMSAGGHPS